MNNDLINVCDYDASHLAEALGYQMRAGRKTRNLLLCAAALIILVYSLWVWLTVGESKYWVSAALSLVMLGMLAFTNFIAPRLTAKSQAAKIQEANGGSAFRFEFREENMLMTRPSGEEDSVEYDRLTRAVGSKRLILVFTNAHTMLILDRAGFQNGTEEDFWTRLTEKCPAILIKKK